MGEVEYAPGEPKGTPWHPHRGFETVTYMIDGVFEHNDSNGGGGTITNGDTQWMTAGAGILHIEKPPAWLVASGGLFHGFQLWVNLPAAQKWSPPRYQDIRANQVALATSPDGGALVRVIAGEVAGRRALAGPGSTYTPMTLVHATLSPGARLSLPWRSDYNALVYVMNGHGTVGAAAPLRTGSVARRRAPPRAPSPSRSEPASSRCSGPVTRSRSSALDAAAAGEPLTEPRRADPRRPPDPRARRLDGPVRDEHARGGRPGGARLPGGPLGSIPAIHGAPTSIMESR